MRYYLREKYPAFKVCAGEALQCPTLLYNGFGEHRIEGIGDKHVPWIHNIRNMDMVAGIDDNPNIRLMRLFNEPAGKEYLKNDVVFTVATDSMEMYQSRLKEENELHGEFTNRDAAVSFEADMLGLSTDAMIEMNYYEKKRMHNLKYFTWVEQQGKTSEELNAQWYDPNYWKSRYAKVEEWDQEIEEFNERTGLLKEYL